MKILLVPLALILFTVSAFPQVSITPMKVIYVRQGDDLPDFKRRFEVTYPIVSGLKSERAKRQFEDTISYWTAFDTTLEENLGDYYWLDTLDYEVPFNRSGIVVIRLFINGSGAYVDGDLKTLVLDTNTGRRVTVREAFMNLPALVEKLVVMQEAAVAEEIESRKEMDPDDAETIAEYMKDKTITVTSLDEFSVSDEGVTFHFDYGFPHVIQALQPNGDYLFTWEEIGPYLRKGGPLSRLRL
ncbi:MAG: hypothetical protein IPM63_05015 [Acidobacteriota bacterium]|nr:MAG: hypothetical protein IPM63_05015 [Acidobacteriota bacterium]